MRNLFDLTGKVAVVTGGANGLGADHVKGYAFYGADVAIIDLPGVDFSKSVASVEAFGRKVKTYECDVTNEAKVKETVEQIVKDFGKIDILLNNAGVGVGGEITTMDLARWNRTLEINVTGYMLMCKYVVPHMKEAGYGKIVMMASADAFIGEKNPLLQRTPYQTSKGAVVALVQSLGCYLAQFGITVNGIAPGTIRTDQSETTLLRHQWFVDHYESKSPQNRFGDREEIIGTVIYLSSDASSHTVGRVIITDGGYTLNS